MSAVQEVQPEAAAVLTKALIRTGEKLGLKQGGIAKVVGVDASTVSRMVSGKAQLRHTSREWDAAATLIKIYRSLGGLLDGNDDNIRAWFNSVNADFGRSPAEVVIEGPAGLYRVGAYLDSLRGRF